MRSRSKNPVKVIVIGYGGISLFLVLVFGFSINWFAGMGLKFSLLHAAFGLILSFVLCAPYVWSFISRRLLEPPAE